MARRSSRDNGGSDDDLSDYDGRRGNRHAPQPTRSDREPDYDNVRKRAVSPPSNRRSRDGDEDMGVQERRPPANRDNRERRPPPGRASRDRDRIDDRDREREPPRDRERSDSRSASRDRPVERNPPRENSSRSREREYDGDDRRRPPPVRTSREPDEGRGGSRNNSRDRGDRDRGGTRNSSRDRYQDDDDDDDHDRVRGSRDRSVRSSREGGVDPRRSREAPKGFTPKSYVRSDGTPPAAAWHDSGKRQFEKENTRPLERGDSWTSASKQRAPPSVMRSSYRADEESDDDDDPRGYNRRTNSTRVNRHNSRDNVDYDDNYGDRDRDPRGDRGRGRATDYDYDDEYGDRRRGGDWDYDQESSRNRDRRPHRRPDDERSDSKGRDSREGQGRRYQDHEFDVEESQDNEVTPFSTEKPKRREAPRRKASPDQARERRLDSDEDEGPRRGGRREDSRDHRDRDRDRDRDWDRERERERERDDRERELLREEERYRQREREGNRQQERTQRLEMEYDEEEDDHGYTMTTWGEDIRRQQRNSTENRKWEDGGISSNDMNRLENFRKSGRYGNGAEESDDNNGKRGGYNYKPSGNVALVNYCPPNGGNTDLFQCYITRERNSISSKLYPTYKLYSQEGDKLLILARKMGMNSTSNYHLFDMTRGMPEKTNLSKKSGNYIGKLRGIDTNHSEYVLVTRSEDKNEVAAIQFDRLGLVSQLKEGCQPRKMSILLPTINSDNEPIPHQLKHTDSSKKKPKSLATLLRRNDYGNMFHLVSKDPIYENGNYRLNFHGRVSIPSVKNFQLTSDNDIDDVICQFGKIGDDSFNLDFKYPLNPFQAFSLALCHFDA